MPLCLLFLGLMELVTKVKHTQYQPKKLPLVMAEVPNPRYMKQPDVMLRSNESDRLGKELGR